MAAIDSASVFKEISVSAPKPLWQTFLAFLVPMMLSNLLQSLSGTINSIYLGQMIGVDALAAASAFFPMMFLIISFGIGLGAGASVLIGQAWGAGERDAVKAVAGTTLAVTLLLSALVAVFGGSLSRPLMIALATPPDILDQAEAYARIMMLTMPLIFVFILFTSLTRGVGDTVTPLLALALSTALGLTMTPALIQGWFGLPRLGVASAAWASAGSTALTLVWLATYLRRKNHPLAPDMAFVRAIRIDVILLRKILRIGIPTALGMIVMSLAELVLLGLVNGFGSSATAAYGAVNQVLSYTQFPALSISITVSIFGAQAIGAGETARLGAIVRTGLLMNLVLTGSLVVLFYLFARPIMGLFITDPAVLELSLRVFHIVLWSSVAFGMATTFSGMMRASGTVFAPLILSVIAIALFEIPSAIALSRSIGIEGVWIAYPVCFCAMLILQMGYYLLFWRRQRIQRLI
jgi:putative MATE family efflux protein